MKFYQLIFTLFFLFLHFACNPNLKTRKEMLSDLEQAKNSLHQSLDSINNNPIIYVDTFVTALQAESRRIKLETERQLIVDSLNKKLQTLSASIDSLKLLVQ